MKLKNVIFIIFMLLGCSNENLFSLQQGVINVPIADLLGQQIQSIWPQETAENSYRNLTICGGQINSPYACPRVHQLLYNDIVEIVKTTQDEMCIRIPQAYYLTSSSSLPQTDYWTLKNNVTPLETISAHNIAVSHLPKPINFSDKNHTALHDPDVITLIEPHHDPLLHITFSVGTRFVRTPTIAKKKSHTCTLFAINYAIMTEHHIKIPTKKCMLIDPKKTNLERITDYIDLLKKWAHTKHGCIPYVWGGTSFTHTTHGTFKEITQCTHNSDYSFYRYENDTSSPKSGFDCSGVIARATQICGIPYFCKNTATIAQCLAPLTTDQTLIPGDLILVRGHVMIVSDIEKNLLIEARSYAHGYGKLHEIKLNHVFDEIETYKDLIDAYFNKKTIKRKDIQGKIRDTFSNLQLFSMMSVWNKNLN